jgi:hypothetical protein
MKTNGIRNPVIGGYKAKEVKSAVIAAQMERDPWFADNMGALLRSYHMGLVNSVVCKNVSERLNRIAFHHATSH